MMNYSPRASPACASCPRRPYAIYNMQMQVIIICTSFTLYTLFIIMFIWSNLLIHIFYNPEHFIYVFFICPGPPLVPGGCARRGGGFTRSFVSSFCYISLSLSIYIYIYKSILTCETFILSLFSNHF